MGVALGSTASEGPNGCRRSAEVGSTTLHQQGRRSVEWRRARQHPAGTPPAGQRPPIQGRGHTSHYGAHVQTTGASTRSTDQLLADRTRGRAPRNHQPTDRGVRSDARNPINALAPRPASLAGQTPQGRVDLCRRQRRAYATGQSAKVALAARRADIRTRQEHGHSGGGAGCSTRRNYATSQQWLTALPDLRASSSPLPRARCRSPR